MASTMGAGAWPAPHSQAVNAPDRSLFAKGLAKGCTSAHLQAIFSAFGTVTDCQIARHRSGRSAGFAIVTFARHEEAVQAMKAVDNLLFMGRRLSVKWFSPERAMEGCTQGLDALNMQALQQVLQLSQLQPVDLMAQLAQMLDAPKLQAPSPHVAAWLDNFALAQRESPLAPTLPDAAQHPAPIDVLNLSALSLADLPGPMMAPGTQPGGLATHPATPTSLDVPDGAVFVTANPTDASGLAHSRLSKWCSAPGTATGPASTAPSVADDATSETASLHASDDSSVATSTHLAPLSCDASEGASPTLAKVEPVSVNAAAAAAVGPASLDPPAVFLNRMQPAGVVGPLSAPRPGVSSEPGARILATTPVFPGAPALPPLRTNAAAAAAFPPHAPRTAPAAIRPSGLGPFSSCGGGAPASMQQALLQQALAEQARNTAQQQYVDALAKLAVAREQMVAAASLLGGNTGALPMGMPAGLSPAAVHRMGAPVPPVAGMLGHGHPFAAAPVPDLSALLMLQNAAGVNGADMGRPFF